MQVIENIVIVLAVIIMIVYCMYLCFNQYLKKLSEILALGEAERIVDEC
jgi:hypothetical protein